MTKILVVSQVVGGDYSSDTYIHVGDDEINFDKEKVLLTVGRKINIGFYSQRDLFIILYDFDNMTYKAIHIGGEYASVFGGQEQIATNRRKGLTVGKLKKSDLSYKLRYYIGIEK